MMFSLQRKETPKGFIVAACDIDILGETYTEDGLTLEVREGFYGGREADLDDVIDALESFFTANLVGNELIHGLMEEGVVEHREVETVDEVKHVQLFQV